MDDTSGWHEVLVEGWGPLVRAAVCDRVEADLDLARGLLAIAAVNPDDAPPAAVERLHDAIIAAIAVETGADLADLGSQSAWATYDDTWAELGRRRREQPGMELVTTAAAHDVADLLATLPPEAVEHAGGVLRSDGTVRLHPAEDGAHAHVHVDGMFRWLATDHTADAATRQRARAVVERARRR